MENNNQFEGKKEQEWFPEAKVYHNGSHFIGIPHMKVRRKKRGKPKEDVFVVSDSDPVDKKASILPTLEEVDSDMDEELDCPFQDEIDTFYEQEKQAKLDFNADMVPSNKEKPSKPKLKRVTRASEFKRLDEESKNMKVKAKKKYIVQGIKRLFKNEKVAEYYVDRKMYNKWRALMERRKRFMRKAFLNRFNYFATFTYDDAKHMEESFRKKLKTCLNHLANRNGWKYMGVWERGGETDRLHFHALVKVPDGEMKGELISKTDFNFKTKRRKKTTQSTYFNELFGRTDFEPIIENDMAYVAAIEYILKYVSKTGERIVYSRGLPMYLISDIQAEDVLCRTGIEDKKLVLYDKFGCWDEGEYLGAMSEETKKRMRSTTS